MKLLLILSILLATVYSSIGQEIESDNCPNQCECNDDSGTSTYTVDCSNINDLSALDFTRPELRDLKVIVRDSDIGDLNANALDNLASNKLTIELRDTEVGFFRANSLDMGGAVSKLTLDLRNVNVQGFDTDALSGANLNAFVATESSINRFQENAFSGVRINIIDWTDIHVYGMANSAFHDSSIETLILKEVRFDDDSVVFTNLVRIARMQISDCTFPMFPENFIPEVFAPSPSFSENTFMYRNNFHTIEMNAFKQAENEQYTLHANEFYENSVICDNRLDWLTAGQLPSYVPQEFYESLVCTLPEAFCGAKLSTCTNLGSVDSPQCEFISNYDCEGINGASGIHQFSFTFISVLMLTIYAVIA